MKAPVTVKAALLVIVAKPETVRSPPMVVTLVMVFAPLPLKIKWW